MSNSGKAVGKWDYARRMTNKSSKRRGKVSKQLKAANIRAKYGPLGRSAPVIVSRLDGQEVEPPVVPAVKRAPVKQVAEDRAERRLEIRSEIEEIVRTTGPVKWRDVQRQIKAPKAQAWTQAQKLIESGRLCWRYDKLAVND